MAWFPALQAVDEAILRVAHGHPAAIVPVFYFFTVVGGGWTLLLAIPLLIQRSTRAAALWLVLAVVMSSGAVTLIKETVRRVRPCDALAWCAAIDVPSPGGASFPSGHAAGSFAFAAFAAVRAPKWPAPALLYALIVAWSRCVLGVHYPSDVLVGSLLGASIGVAVARYSRRPGGALVTSDPA